MNSGEKKTRSGKKSTGRKKALASRRSTADIWEAISNAVVVANDWVLVSEIAKEFDLDHRDLLSSTAKKHLKDGGVLIGQYGGKDYFVSTDTSARTKKIQELVVSKGREKVTTLSLALGFGVNVKKRTDIYRFIKLTPGVTGPIRGEVLVDHNHTTKPKERQYKERDKKRLIGQAAARLIVGEIDMGSMPALVRKQLDNFWAKPIPVIAIDGGTTTKEVAKNIRTIRRRIIRVVTNYDEVASEFTLGEDPHDVILVGGGKRQISETFVGSLAEQCYLALNVHPGMSIIGVTGVDKKYRFGTSHPDETRMKTLMLQADVRCVALDSSKIINMAGSDWVFAGLDSVDIIITDGGILSDEERSADLQRHAEVQDVFVLIAE